ncbi:hypothetical protein EDM22_09825 [Agromyces tardus]|uniref:Uncharacterized protein n=1 Tax=Agromyces tardus TaxID=2583849 RepID=A0A3M8AF01_9MICO|nr:hypothetical protein EDM22_09825 [Agromyces tardus]
MPAATMAARSADLRSIDRLDIVRDADGTSLSSRPIVAPLRRVGQILLGRCDHSESASSHTTTILNPSHSGPYMQPVSR